MIHSETVKLALEALRSNKLRTFLTMFGIAWGIVSITLMVAAGEGLRAGQRAQMETFGKDIMGSGESMSPRDPPQALRGQP